VHHYETTTHYSYQTSSQKEKGGEEVPLNLVLPSSIGFNISALPGQVFPQKWGIGQAPEA